jgi:hypothetical protein
MMEIEKREYYLIATILAFLMPLILAVVFWWTVASLDIFKIVAVSEQIIAIAACTGLAIGIVLDFVFLKKWTPKFYEMNKSVSVLLYLFCSLMAVAFCMGVPVGNLFLGLLAGIYIGRKCHYLNSDQASFASAAKNVSIFSAFVTSIEALPIGLLALQEESIINSVNRIFGFVLFHANKIIDVLLIMILSCILFGVQFIITRFGTRLSFRNIS